MGPASIAELVLNFAINTCFGLSGTKTGQPHAGKLMGLSVAMGVIDLFVELFAGGGDPPPAPAGISQADLDRSLDDLANRIEQDIFDMFQSGYLEDVKAVIRQFDATWTVLQAAQTSYTGDPDEDANLLAQWKKAFDFFDDEAQPGSSKCLKACSFVTDQVALVPGNHLRKYQTLPLYMLAAGAYLNACQFVMLREWQKIRTAMMAPGSSYKVAHDAYVNKDLPKYKTDLATWQAAKDAWDQQELARVKAAKGGVGGFGGGLAGKLNHPGGPVIVTFNDDDDDTVAPMRPYAVAAPVKPEPPPAPPISPSKVIGSPSADSIRTYVAAALDYAVPLIADLDAAITADQALRAKLLDHTINDDVGGGRRQVYDSATGFRSWTVPDDVATDSIRIEQGIVRAGMAQQGDPVAQAISPDDLSNYKQSISAWVQTFNNYALDGTAPRIDPYAT